jgi:hypothetical protein
MVELRFPLLLASITYSWQVAAAVAETFLEAAVQVVLEPRLAVLH